MHSDSKDRVHNESTADKMYSAKYTTITRSEYTEIVQVRGAQCPVYGPYTDSTLHTEYKQRVHSYGKNKVLNESTADKMYSTK